MSEMPDEIYVSVNEKGILRASSNEGVYNKNRAKYHHDDKYRALEAENVLLREENERLKTAIAEARIVQYAVGNND